MQLSIISYNIEGISLETNYCNDQTLKKYIISKSVYLNKYLSSLNVDIICIQEYSSVLNLDLENYYVVKKDYNAIFYKKNKFVYVKHAFDDIAGLSVTINVGGLTIEVVTNRFAPYQTGCQLRNIAINMINDMAKNKIFIFAGDTNMRKSEETVLNNFVDCYHSATINQGFYTLDKKFNPYFSGDKTKVYRARYDRIYCSNLFDCEQLIVIKPVCCPDLVHELYPYGGISDHYPIMAILTIG